MALLHLALLALLGGLASAGPAPLSAQEEGATLLGRVLDGESGAPVEGAVVSVEGPELAALTDSLGRWRIPGVPAGPQVLRVRRIGFAEARIPVTVPARGTVRREIRLRLSALEMEDIMVTADAAGRARGELGTASVIERDAIEHLTATSLAGVLELVPGGDLQAPGLDGVEQVSLRTVPTRGDIFGFGADAGRSRTAADLAAFGTLIVLDGVPLSNNANLQTLGPRGELSFVSSAGGGVDLRRIPANTIERVEVIRGVPSVRYGDLTQGAIVVETRAAAVPPILSGKFDARTAEASTVGGWTMGSRDHAATLQFDVTRTLMQPGVLDDVATRWNGQLAHRVALGRDGGPGAEPRLELDTRFDFFQLVDDRPRKPEIRPERSFRSRDRGFRLSERARLGLGGDTHLSFTGALSLTQQRSTSRDLKVSGTQPFTDRREEGRAEGFYIGGPYVTRVEVEGEPWLAFSRLELEREMEGPGGRHRLRGGLALRREWNSGPGVQFDVSSPPQISFNGVRGYDRPRTYESVPPLVTSGAYLDDRLETEVAGLPLKVQGGLRLDLLHEGSSWFTGVRDQVLEPRVNVELQPETWLRLRAGWGRTAKAPALGDLFPGPQYYDLVNVNFFADDPAERLAVLTTFIEDPTNPDLAFSVGTKAEVGVELGLGESALSLVAFRDRVEGAVGIAGEPDWIPREHFALTDSITGNGIPTEIITPATSVDTVPILVDRPANIFDLRNEGLELTASLPPIRPISTRLEVSGAWIRTRRESDALFFGTSSEFSNFQLLAHDERTPFWEGLTQTGERALALYRVIHHQPELGLVITGTLQHNITDEIRDIAGTDTLAFAGYVTRTGELVRVPEERRSDPEFRDLRVARSGSSVAPERAPADWMASVRVSKTLPADGTLTFWAFNFLYRRGVSTALDRLPRPYPDMRFGLEVNFPTGRWW